LGTGDSPSFSGATIGSGTFSVNGVSVGRGGGGISTNTAVGSEALAANTTGVQNTAIGQNAASSHTTGTGNVAVGRSALAANTTSNSNVAVGAAALVSNTGGTNVAIGQNALGNNTTGSTNTAAGNIAGRFIADGSTANAVTTNSVYLGNDTRALASGQTNQIVIGHQAVGAGSNSVTLGNDSVTLTQLKGNVVVQRGAQDTTNFERLGMRWDGFDAKIGTSKGGTGGPRDLVFEADGTERLRVTAAGELRTSSTLYFSATEDFATRRNLTNLDFVLPSGGTGSFRFRNGLSGHIPFLINQSGNVGINTQSPSHRLDVVGSIRASQPIIFPTYTVATAPVGASYIGGMIYVSDEAGGPTMAFYDGTNWRRVQDRAIISLPA
jgi:hypothetical protein